MIIESDSRSTTDISTNKFKLNRFHVEIDKYLIIRCNLSYDLVENLVCLDFTKECNLNYEPISAKKFKHDEIHTFKAKANKTIHEKTRCKRWARFSSVRSIATQLGFRLSLNFEILLLLRTFESHSTCFTDCFSIPHYQNRFQFPVMRRIFLLVY